MHFSFVTFFVLIATTAWCGRRQGRILGGEVVGQRPYWMVSIKFMGRHRCGATILTDRWLLTAAHCLLDFRDSTAIRIGMANESAKVDTVLLHPSFATTGLGSNDIALLRLAPRQRNNFNTPCLPDDYGMNLTGRVATVLGWGLTSEKSFEFSSELRQVRVPLLSNQECRQWMRMAGRNEVAGALRDGQHLCAGYAEGGRDACVGDSGGPLVLRDNRRRGLVVVGIASGGVGCGRRLLPGIYTRVSHHLAWIRDTIKAHRDRKNFVSLPSG